MIKKILKNVMSLLRLIKNKKIIQAYKLRKVNKELSKLNKIYQILEADFISEANLTVFYKDQNIARLYQMIFEFYQKLKTLKPNESNKFIEIIEEMKPSMLNVFQWLALYRFFSLRGRFFTANLFREKAISITLSLKSNIFTPMILFLKFTALFELGDIKSAEKVLKKMKTSPFRLLFSIKSYDRIIMIYSGKTVRDDFNNNDSKYNELIKNKTIAVVGPAPSEINYNDEIDSSDLVVRLNYNGQEYDSIDNKGTKINLSYFNGEFSRKIFIDNDSVINKLDYYILKSNYKPIIKKYLDLMKSRKLEYFRVEFDGSFNMIQLTILDLLKFKPKLIKLYGTNFFLSKKSHSNTYITDLRNKDFYSKYKTFTVHNPILQFRTVKNLRNAGLIDVDKDLAQILNLDENFYLRELQDLYGTDL